MSEPKRSEQIYNTLRLIETLAGNEFDPLRTSEVATAMGIVPSQATRMLQQLVLCGWAEKTPDERWRLKAGKMTNIAVAVMNNIQRAKSRLDNQANNLTRSPY